jgi:hypothetical protein
VKVFWAQGWCAAEPVCQCMRGCDRDSACGRAMWLSWALCHSLTDSDLHLRSLAEAMQFDPVRALLQSDSQLSQATARLTRALTLKPLAESAASSMFLELGLVRVPIWCQYKHAQRYADMHRMCAGDLRAACWVFKDGWAPHGCCCLPINHMQTSYDVRDTSMWVCGCVLPTAQSQCCVS